MPTHNHVRKLLAGVLLIVTTVFRTKSAGNDNIADFVAVCGVVNLQQKKEEIIKQPALPPGDTLLTDLRKLNLSTATDSWFNEKDGEFSGNSKDPDGTKLKAWKNAAKDAVKETEAKPNLFKRLPSGGERLRANAIIANLLKEAEGKLAAYNTKVEEVTKAEQTAADKIDQAVFGNGQKEFDKAKYDKATHKGKGRNKVCGNGQSGDTLAGDAAADALTCMCTGDSVPAASECYNSGTKQVRDAGNNAAAALTAWQEIVTKCALLNQPSAISAATIEAAGQGVRNRIGAANSHQTATNGAYTLGKTADGDCDGSANNTFCINYKTQLTNGGAGIKWLTALNEAADHLTKAQIAYTDALDLRRGLQQLSRQARDAYRAAAHDIANPLPITQPIQPTATKLTKEEDCNKHQSNSTCKSPCSWNDKATDPNKKCSLDTTKAEEQAAQAAGTGEKTETEKCKGKGEKDCKDGCKWEGKECKDSSILVNKKLDLISSTFKSLVTF
uniref:Variant surface glycoprotein 486 n=1 Tax=Trypanosoma brucei TaxID=5691 RepID=M4SY72_9TRYP|nr:variant surface glycoprotein 486 [Trypanosoma brucei]